MTSPPRPVHAARPWAEELFTYGVTGTNGKTSTAAMIRACLRAAGRSVFSLMTTGAAIDETPIDKGKSFDDFVDMVHRGVQAGCRDLVIEATSLGLSRGYARNWRFDLGVFTNLSPDHLKTHGTWENYLAAKAQLFLHLGPGRTMVLNAADEYATFIHRAVPEDVHRLWFRVPSRGPAHHAADLQAREVALDLDGTSITLDASPLAEALGGHLRVPIIGEVFAENALAAAAAAHAGGLRTDAIVRGLAECPAVPGRFEVLARSPAVVVDYAHTADALTRTCDAARAVAKGRVIVVFGASGGSTPQKRGPMGEAVGRACDLAIVTSDNPRHEDPEMLAAAVVAGVERGGRARVRTILDRGKAIAAAIEAAGVDDVVVVAGMGHEVGQRIGNTTIAFSDREEVRRLTGG